VPEKIIITVSSADAAAIDKIRGRRTRQAWAAAALRTAITAAGRERLTVPADGPCPHPPARVHKGLCGQCGQGGLQKPPRGPAAPPEGETTTPPPPGPRKPPQRRRRNG
jgi:hypothetical protein